MARERQDRRQATAQARGLAARQRVLEAALSVVSQGPLVDVRISHIAEHAGMNATTVLYYYPSKVTIFVETLRWAEQRLAEQRAAELPRLAGPEQRLARYISLYLPTGPDDPVWKLWLEAWLRSTTHPEISQIEFALVTRWAEDFQAIAREGIDSGRFVVDDPEDYFDDLAALLAGFAVQILVGASPRKVLLRRAIERAARDLGADVELMLPELRARARRRAVAAVPGRALQGAPR